jgi:hypothetical protein
MRVTRPRGGVSSAYMGGACYPARLACSSMPPSRPAGVPSGAGSRAPATAVPGAAGVCARPGGRGVVQRSVHDFASLQYQRMSAHAWPPSGTSRPSGCAMPHMEHWAASSGRSRSRRLAVGGPASARRGPAGRCSGPVPGDTVVTDETCGAMIPPRGTPVTRLPAPCTKPGTAAGDVDRHARSYQARSLWAARSYQDRSWLGQARSYQARVSKVATHVPAAQGTTQIPRVPPQVAEVPQPPVPRPAPGDPQRVIRDGQDHGMEVPVADRGAAGHGRERTARGSVQLGRDRASAAMCSRSLMAGMTAGQVTGTASPACPRRWETRCRQVTPGVGGISRAPRRRARRRCPGPRGRSGPRRSAGPGWPGWPRRRTGRRRSRARSAR